MVPVDSLCRQLRQRYYVPFIGAGFSGDVVPTAQGLIEEWKSSSGLPIGTDVDLKHVAQILIANENRLDVRLNLCQKIMHAQKQVTRDQFFRHRVLSRLPTSVFLTTNYDDLLAQALESQGREPIRIVVPWYWELGFKSEETSWGLKPAENGLYYLHGRTDLSPERGWKHPWVVHLHGHCFDPMSLVLTEEDYTDYILKLREDTRFLHHMIQRFLSLGLCVLGYSLSDETFRVMLRAILKGQTSTRVPSVTIQLPVSEKMQNVDKASAFERRYHEVFGNYFNTWWFDVVWKELTAFMCELDRILDSGEPGLGYGTA